MLGGGFQDREALGSEGLVKRVDELAATVPDQTSETLQNHGDVHPIIDQGTHMVFFGSWLRLNGAVEILLRR